MTGMDSAETVRTKEAFARFAFSYDVHTKHYHYNNNLFNRNIFHNSTRRSNQTISFCGVNAHHQNGKSERKNVRTVLLHASHRWPKAIDASIWLAALKNYINIRNNIPTEYIPGPETGRNHSSNKFIGSPLFPNFPALKVHLIEAFSSFRVSGVCSK